MGSNPATCSCAASQNGSSYGPISSARHMRAGESGYTLLVVIFLLFVFTIGLSVAVPKMKRALQRDQEVETKQRGKQYIRAIQLYYRKFNAFPLSIDALIKQNNLRFLRKKYKDPTTGKEDWKLIHYGQAKTQTLGFFGKPLSGVGGLGGFGGGIGGGIGPVNTTSGSNLFGSNPTDSSSTQDPNSQQSSTIQPSGTDPSTSTQSSSGQSGTVPYGQSGFGQSGIGQTGQTGIGQSGQSGSGQNGTGLSGQTFGGGGIIGVEPGNPKVTTIVYRKKNHYNEWEFIYDPALERYYESGAAGLPTGQQPAGSSGFGGSGSGGFGGSSSGFGGSGTGSGSGFGSGSGGNSGGSGQQGSPLQ
jgi:type II secretory pathway pseudopilin PulG